jgi:hypothetical protein
LQQAMTYAQMLDVPFAFSSNGDGFAEHDFLTGKERTFGLDEFPTEKELVERYKAAANATGYDVVLGTDSKKENGETRPYHYGDHKVLNLKEGTVTATFKNVPKGTWVVGMHAFNRTSEDGKKVFSPWSNLKKATVK